LLLSYQTGEISSLLDEVYDCKPLNVAKALEQYQPACPKEEMLLVGFRNGLPFISEDSIMKYDYNADCGGFSEDCEDCEDYPPVILDRVIRYVHTLNDLISNELENSVSQCLQETYAVEPTSYMFLKPCSALFVPNDYPERFSQWFLDMVNIIISISNHE
jgi:hypothetical protein